MIVLIIDDNLKFKRLLTFTIEALSGIKYVWKFPLPGLHQFLSVFQVKNYPLASSLLDLCFGKQFLQIQPNFELSEQFEVCVWFLLTKRRNPNKCNHIMREKSGIDRTMVNKWSGSMDVANCSKGVAWRLLSYRHKTSCVYS